MPEGAKILMVPALYIFITVFVPSVTLIYCNEEAGSVPPKKGVQEKKINK